MNGVMDKVACGSGIQEAPVYSGSAIHRFDDVCRMLGMAQHAPNGWKKLHVKPHVICVACFSSWAVQCAIGAVLFAAGVPWLSPVVHPC